MIYHLAIVTNLNGEGWLSNLARKADDMRARISEMAKELNLDSASSIFKKSQESDDSEEVDEILWEIAKMDGIIAYREWLTKHIWTYVGLGAPMLGAPAPTRSVISGETMGLPMTDKSARDLEITFGSTHTANVISTKMGFCYPAVNRTFLEKNSNLACLDEVVDEIESSSRLVFIYDFIFASSHSPSVATMPGRISKF